MSIVLDRIGWEDEPSTNTPIDSGNLKKMEDNTEKAVNEVDNKYEKNIATLKFNRQSINITSEWRI